jgi:hypothetical protein
MLFSLSFGGDKKSNFFDGRENKENKTWKQIWFNSFCLAINSIHSLSTWTTAPSPWANPPQMEATPIPPPLLLNS